MKDKYYKIARFNPSITTLNLGDCIIDYYCKKALEELFGEYMALDVPTRDHLSRFTSREIAKSDYAFICGSNLLASNMNHEKQWMLRMPDALKVRFGAMKKKDIMHPGRIKDIIAGTHVILLGAGWHGYQKEPNTYTKFLLNTLLDHSYIHSVRDSYTEKKLREAGFTNVMNTACPTMWGLTEKHCSEIPVTKAKSVVFTLTDYQKNPERDRKLVNILRQEYEHVYFWLQSLSDRDYLYAIGMTDRVHIIPPTIQAYDTFLHSDQDIDYIGTRLHGGIHALNIGRRTAVIAVDNRAVEIAKDTGLPVLDVTNSMEVVRNWIYNETPTRIRLPIENILKWKQQFENR